MRTSVNIIGLPIEPGFLRDSSTVMVKQFTPASVMPYPCFMATPRV